ncbi:hypothetical protein AVEN_191271-1 [Araneus ventricosus]|uniref:Uncharacterized protein n=1 Tax=Araneus ventricosus TaxID=182803 RepID=A0A4Y2KJ94_ARAVE|nr:hypothetical protein AVEN_191271-1 [Araneus ventricosus]
MRKEKQKTPQAIGKTMDRLIVTKRKYFDGRKDNTTFKEKTGTKIYQRMRKEVGNMSICDILPTSYTLASGTSSDIAKCILKYLEDNDVGINELEAISCDGTETQDGKMVLSVT